MAEQPNTSGTYSFQPALAEWGIEAFERLQIFPPAITAEHIISMRRSANIVLNDWSSRGINLWVVGDQPLTIPLIPGKATYQLPGETVAVLDTYLRQYTPSSTYTSLGNALTPVVMGNGQPMLQATGEPMILAPNSGTFSTVAGELFATMKWPFHGLAVGAPVFFQAPVMIGPMSVGGVNGFATVASVIDHETIQITLPHAATETRADVGGTPLLVSTAGSGFVDVVLPEHNLTLQDQFAVQVPTQVGGLTLSGAYRVTNVLTPYRFTIQVAGTASTGASVFENQGQILATSQSASTQFTDTLLWQISRNDYAALPQKFVKGRPSIIWFDRTIVPSISVWATAQDNSNWAIIAWRMREVQDANPLMGQQPEIPRRFFSAFPAFLAASLAEKFKPDAWPAKLQEAERIWDRVSKADREAVSSFIVPQLRGYYR